MNKAPLLAAASIIALCVGSASAAGESAASFAGKSAPMAVPKGAKLLWNQNSGYSGTNVPSENFTSGVFSFTYNSYGADDFVVPKGRTWQVTEVDVSGAYSYDYEPAVSENVIFYEDKKGKPGKPVRNGTFANLEAPEVPTSPSGCPGRVSISNPAPIGFPSFPI